MAKDSPITWTDSTFNAWWGCFKISPGCKHCYADAFDHRLGGDHWGEKAPRRFFGDKHWNEPLKWSAAAIDAGIRRRVFCSSMSDVFEDRRDLDPHRERLWKLIDATAGGLDWLLLTKRPENFGMLPTAPPNVWRGVTVEDADYLYRVDILRRTPAAVRFVSAEPLLGPIDFEKIVHKLGEHSRMTANALQADDGFGLNAKRNRIDWVIVGGESGTEARPFDLAWGRSIVAQCQRNGVACFVKQMGDNPTCVSGGRTLELKLSSHHGEDWIEWPDDLRVREFPR